MSSRTLPGYFRPEKGRVCARASRSEALPRTKAPATDAVLVARQSREVDAGDGAGEPGCLPVLLGRAAAGSVARCSIAEALVRADRTQPMSSCIGPCAGRGPRAETRSGQGRSCPTRLWRSAKRGTVACLWQGLAGWSNPRCAGSAGLDQIALVGAAVFLRRDAVVLAKEFVEMAEVRDAAVSGDL